MNNLNPQKVILFGCGGIGSEVIKLLSKYKVTLVDFDKIEISNLNRQFYFTENDLGKYKCEVIANKLGHEYIVSKIEKLSKETIDGFDLIICCLDNISARMEANYLFKRSKCPLLIDCGVEKYQLHVKRVYKNEPCLYCIKDLYKIENEPYLCSLSDSNVFINLKNRNKILWSLIFQKKQNLTKEEIELKKDEVVLEIKELFNDKCEDGLKTNEYEISSILDNIMPSLCTINSICASFCLKMIEEDVYEDFIFADFTGFPNIQKIKIFKEDSCFICDQMKDII